MKQAERTCWARIQEAMRDKDKKGTQKEAEAMFGVTQATVSGVWNKAKGGPTVEHARLIAKKLGICVEWIYTGEGPKRPPPVDRDLEWLCERWARLSEGKRQRIIGYLEGGDDSQSPTEKIAYSAHRTSQMMVQDNPIQHSNHRAGVRRR